MMDEMDERLIVASAMKRSGGSFVQALGECLIHADPFNVRRIKRAFPQYYSQYLTIGKAHEKRDA